MLNVYPWDEVPSALVSWDEVPSNSALLLRLWSLQIAAHAPMNSCSLVWIFFNPQMKSALCITAALVSLLILAIATPGALADPSLSCRLSGQLFSCNAHYRSHVCCNGNMPPARPACHGQFVMLAGFWTQSCPHPMDSDGCKYTDGCQCYYNGETYFCGDSTPHGKCCNGRFLDSCRDCDADMCKYCDAACLTDENIFKRRYW
jgi:hypothetical protein